MKIPPILSARNWASISISLLAHTGSLVVGAKAATVNIDLTHFPNGSQVSEGTVLSDQYRGDGVIFGARRSGEPVLQDSNTIDVQASFLNSIDRGFLFYNPDVYGAVAILNFVQPGTTNPTPVSSFIGISDDHFRAGERVEIWTFDQVGAFVSSETIMGSQGPGAVVGIDSPTPFYSLEIRTFGDPGIAIKNISFTPAPEPSSTFLFATGIAGFVARRRRFSLVEPARH